MAADHFFCTQITVSDVLHSHILSDDRFRMYNTIADVLEDPG